MCTFWTHAAVGLALGRLQTARAMPARYWVASALLAAIPDLDGVGFWLGIPYDSTLGHRGLMHSIPFAMAAAAIVVLAFFRDPLPVPKWRLWLQFTLAMASHGLLDMLTNGGHGIALLAPLWNERFFFPWTPIEVSPLYPRDFFSSWGWQVIKSEALWVNLPTLIIVITVELFRLTFKPRRGDRT